MSTLTPQPAAPGGAPGPELEALRLRLEESGYFRVLRRLLRRDAYVDPRSAPVGARLFTALYVDTETTGLEPGADKVIELGMLAFDYDLAGNVYGVRDAFEGLEDPGRPLPQEVVDITGITDADVRGRRFDDAAVAGALAAADLVIAHNAAFDRPFLERRFPAFAAKPWACSQRDVPWRDLGYPSSSLEYLAFRRGFFFDGHRAIVDCRAGLELLAVPLPDGGPPPLLELRRSALKRTVRLWAEGAPIAKKDLLKARGYRFNGASRVWWRELPAEDHDAELAWLAAEVYGRATTLPYRELGAAERYSARVPESLPADAARR